jgi:hypothetical protein
MFSVVWRLGQDWWASAEAEKNHAKQLEEQVAFQSQGHAR